MRALIVDDEAPARSELRYLLDGLPVEVVGEADNAVTALALARDAAAVVAYGHTQAAPANARPDEQVQRTLRLAVLDRVLDERLDEQRRQPNRECVRRRVDRHFEL